MGNFIFKIRVTAGEAQWSKRGDVTTSVRTYTQSLWFFGILINAVTIYNITKAEAFELFGINTPL